MRRNERDTGRAKWLIISITTISVASSQVSGFAYQGAGMCGPAKCLKYLSPAP